MQAKARQHYIRASKHAAHSDWQSALEGYRTAYALFPHASTLYNISFCLAKLGRFTEAWQLAALTLHDSAHPQTRHLSEQRRAVAESHLKDMRTRVAFVRLKGSSAAAVLVGNDELIVRGVPRQPLFQASRSSYIPERFRSQVSASTEPALQELPIVLSPGRHELLVRYPDGRSSSVFVQVKGGEEQWVQHQPPTREIIKPQTLPPSPPATSSTPAALAETPEANSASSTRWQQPAGYAALGVGGVGVIVASVFAVIATQADQELSERCNAEGVCPPSSATTVERYRRAARWTNVGVLAGVLGAGAGTTLLLWPFDQSEAQVSVNASPEISVGWNF